MPWRSDSTTSSWLATAGAAAYGIVQGAWMIDGGQERFLAPGYTTMRKLLDAQSWGVWALVAGTLIAVGLILRHRKASWAFRALGLLALASWAAAFGISALVNALTIPTVGTTGGPTYLLVGFLLGVLIAYDDRPKRRRA